MWGDAWVWLRSPPHVFTLAHLVQQEVKFEAKFRDAIRYYEPAVRNLINLSLPVMAMASDRWVFLLTCTCR